MLCCWLALAAASLGGVNEDWQRILALEAGPPLKFSNREEARLLAVHQLDLQEPSLRAFVAAYPDDPRNIDARLRLAHLLAVRSDLESKPAAYAESMQILDDLEKSGATPRERLSDVAFARISLHMSRLQEPTPNERDDLLGQARIFQSRFPGDRRIAPLLTEIATLYDADPRQKEDLLDEALRNNPDAPLTRRINDDLKRISLLGKPLALGFTSTQGNKIDVQQFHGKVTLIYFFAAWSSPSVAGLGVVKGILSQFTKEEVQPLGISLDVDRAALSSELKTYDVGWPIYFDGMGWEGSLVRTLGINALPTVWLLDRGGNLRTLSSRDDTERLIRALLRER